MIIDKRTLKKYEQIIPRNRYISYIDNVAYPILVYPEICKLDFTYKNFNFIVIHHVSQKYVKECMIISLGADTY